MLPEQEIESLRSFVDYSSGEILTIGKTRKRPKLIAEGEDNNVQHDDEAGK